MSEVQGRVGGREGQSRRSGWESRQAGVWWVERSSRGPAFRFISLAHG